MTNRVLDERTGIYIDPTADDRLNDFAKRTFEKSWSRPGETPQMSLARAASAWSGGDAELAQRLYDASAKKWFMWASPMISNAPLPGEEIKKMPISCFLTYVDDTTNSLKEHYEELIDLTVGGGGLGGHWSRVRAADNKSRGIIGHQTVVNALMETWSQSSRRGSYCAHLDDRHPDLMEFIGIRLPTQGDPMRKCMSKGYHHAVVLSDEFMRAVEDDKTWELRCPKNDRKVNEFRARDIWYGILDSRMKQGEPYIVYKDNVLRWFPEAQKKLGLEFHGSNLCNEITLATGVDRTAVCCLSSGNLELVDEWWGTTLIEDLLTALDNALQVFIDNATRISKGYAKAVYSAFRERAVGLGMMGFHALLQKRNVPFESKMAQAINKKVFREIRRRADAIDLKLGAERGPAPDMQAEGRRFSHKLAIAPNATSANGIGTSPGIEPFNANLFVQNTSSGTHVVRSSQLVRVLTELGRNTDDVWHSITVNKGSVQHLDFLSEHTKLVFRTARELDQQWIVQHAADRVPFICQSQSVNLFFWPDSDPSLISDVHFNAWRMGMKGLYYLRGRRSEDANVSGKVERRVVGSGAANSNEPELRKIAALCEIPASDTIIIQGLPVEEESTCLACEG